MPSSSNRKRKSKSCPSVPLCMASNAYVQTDTRTALSKTLCQSEFEKEDSLVDSVLDCNFDLFECQNPFLPLSSTAAFSLPSSAGHGNSISSEPDPEDWTTALKRQRATTYCSPKSRRLCNRDMKRRKTDGCIAPRKARKPAKREEVNFFSINNDIDMTDDTLTEATTGEAVLMSSDRFLEALNGIGSSCSDMKCSKEPKEAGDLVKQPSGGLFQIGRLPIEQETVDWAALCQLAIDSASQYASLLDMNDECNIQSTVALPSSKKVPSDQGLIGGSGLNQRCKTDPLPTPNNVSSTSPSWFSKLQPGKEQGDFDEEVMAILNALPKPSASKQKCFYNEDWILHPRQDVTISPQIPIEWGLPGSTIEMKTLEQIHSIESPGNQVDDDLDAEWISMDAAWTVAEDPET